MGQMQNLREPIICTRIGINSSACNGAPNTHQLHKTGFAVNLAQFTVKTTGHAGFHGVEKFIISNFFANLNFI